MITITSVLRFISSTIDLYVSFFWISLPLTLYLGFEFNGFMAGRGFYTVRAFKKLRDKIGEWKEKRQ